MKKARLVTRLIGFTPEQDRLLCHQQDKTGLAIADIVRRALDYYIEGKRLTVPIDYQREKAAQEEPATSPSGPEVADW